MERLTSDDSPPVQGLDRTRTGARARTAAADRRTARTRLEAGWAIPYRFRGPRARSRLEPVVGEGARTAPLPLSFAEVDRCPRCGVWYPTAWFVEPRTKRRLCLTCVEADPHPVAGWGNPPG